MKGNTTKDVLPTIEYQDRQILLSVLGQFLLLGQNGSSGSRAVSADHSRLFVKALNAVAKQYQYAFQKDVINRWVDFNYSNLPNGYPKLNFSTISDEDVQETANAVNSLMAVSALHPDRDMENRLRKMLNMPPLTDEDYDNYDKNITAAQLKPDPNDPNAIQVQAKKDKSLINTPDKTSSNPSNPDTKDLPTATGNGTPNKLTAEAIAQAKAVQKRLLHLWADADLSNARA
jgi:phage gp29-like protein